MATTDKRIKFEQVQVKDKDAESPEGTVADGQPSKLQKIAHPFPRRHGKGDLKGRGRGGGRGRGKGKAQMVGQLQHEFGEAVMNLDTSSRHVYYSEPVFRSLTPISHFQATLYDIE